MSTILKALKKLEDEKRAAAPVDLAVRLVAEPSATRRSSQSALLVAAGATGGLLLTVAVICGWFWMRSAEPDGIPAQVSAPVRSTLPAPAAMPAPVNEQLASSDKGLVAETLNRPAGNAAEPRSVVSPAPSPAKLTVTAAPQPLPPPPAQIAPAQLAAAAPPLYIPPPAEVMVTDRQIPPPGQQWSTPHLAVTDIFPPSAGNGWMAVVNGLPVMEGTIVEDAVVEEIRADRVLFLIQGKVVAVQLSKER